MIAALALAAAGCLVAVLPALVSEIYALCASLPDFVARVSAWLSGHFPQLKDIIAEKSASLREGALKNLSVSVALGYAGNFFKTAASATGGAVAFASFAAAFAVAPIYLYYMLTSRFDFFAFLENNIGFMSPKMKEDAMFFARRFASIMSAFFRGQMTIAFIMGVLIGLGLTLVGVKFGFLLGFMILSAGLGLVFFVYGLTVKGGYEMATGYILIIVGITLLLVAVKLKWYGIVFIDIALALLGFVILLLLKSKSLIVERTDEKAGYKSFNG